MIFTVVETQIRPGRQDFSNKQFSRSMRQVRRANENFSGVKFKIGRDKKSQISEINLWIWRNRCTNEKLNRSVDRKN